MMPTSRLRNNRTGVEAGYTLFELLVVIAIIGLLAAVATPRLASAREFGGRQRRMMTAAAILAETRTVAMASGRAISVDEARLVQSEPALRLVGADGTPSVRFYADGSSTGGVVLLAGRPLLTIDWLTGRAADPAGPSADAR